MMRWLGACLIFCLTGLPAWAQGVSGQFSLIDQNGRAVTQDDYGGRVRVVTFGYTFCPDICPTTLATVTAALDLLKAQAAQVAPIFVTVDPNRDKPAILKDYMAAFGPELIGLTGTADQVDQAAQAFKVRYQIHPPENPKEPDYYLVDHSAGIFIMDRKGGFYSKLGHRSSAEELADRITEALNR